MFAYYAMHFIFFVSVPVCGGLDEVTDHALELVILVAMVTLNSYLLHAVRRRPGYVAKDQLGCREIEKMPQIIEPFPVEIQRCSIGSEEVNLTDRAAIHSRDITGSELQDLPRDQM